jgi:short-subunit dehydrogenase
MRLNTLVLTLASHAVLGGMVERDSGSIVNIASVIGLLAEYSHGIYGATKSYVLTMSQSLYAEIAG